MRRIGFWLLLIALGMGVVWFEFKPDKESPIAAEAPVDTRVRDGDTLTVNGADVRLEGIDAPELRQQCRDAKDRPWLCGEAAKAQLVLLTAMGEMSCAPSAEDRYGRKVARCRTDATPDLSAAMVSAGYAIGLGDRGEAAYRREEDSAKAARRGIWQGKFDPPSTWRDANPRPPRQENAP